jgi:8-oxo-dGTP pyrophosphatase MutT (NUDIX family)
VAAGLVVKALDTGRVLLLQRSLTDENDPAAGRWECPGGGIEPGEGPLEAALREWEEEIGQPLPAGRLDGSWTSDNGVYRGFVYLIASETDVQINGDPPRILNPDSDPDGAEVAAWWDPTELAPLPILRDEARLNPWGMIAAAGHAFVVKSRGALQESEDLRRWRSNARSRVAKGQPPRRGDWPNIPQPVRDRVWAPLAQASTREQVDAAFDVAKSADPKVSARMGPGREHPDRVVAHYLPKITDAMTTGWDVQSLARAWHNKGGTE